MKRAFIFTLDAILAILLASALILASFSNLSQTKTIQWSKSAIYQLSMSSLATLELSYGLQDPVKIQEFLDNLLPKNVCAKIETYDAASSLVSSNIKTGCTASDEVSVAYRSFIINSNPYYAKMEAWYR